MKKRCGIIAGIAISLILALCIMVDGPVAAEELVTVDVPVTYGQTEARSMLKLINDFRTGDDAWAWDRTNQTQQKYDGLSELTYDYELEKIAMQRAAEISIMFGHERPKGGFIVSPSSVYAENIAAGYSTAEEAFVGWQETNDNYEGQGHRRNMLEKDYNAIGIGHVKVDGVDYWTQEFALKNTGAQETPANDSLTNVPVEIASQYISNPTVSLSEGSEYSVQLGTAVEVPTVSVSMTIAGNKVLSSEITPEWSVKDSSIVSISDGKITGLKLGTTELTATVQGKTFTVSIEVTPLSIETAEIKIADQKCTGQELKPDIQVILNGKTLVKDQDYTVTYKNNIYPGSAVVTVKGKGIYTGTKEATFTITCDHEKTVEIPGVPATCTEDGTEAGIKCAICGKILQQKVIPALGHDEVPDPTKPAKEPTDTEPGLTQGTKCSRCGIVIKEQQVIPAKNGQTNTETSDRSPATSEPLNASGSSNFGLQVTLVMAICGCCVVSVLAGSSRKVYRRK